MARKYLSRRGFLSLAAAATGATVLAACQPKVVEKVVKETVEVVKEKEKVVTATPVSVKKVTMEFWGLTFAEGSPDVHAIETFNKMTPTIEVKPTQMERDKMIAAVAAGAPPDLLNTFYEPTATFASEGVIIPLDPYIEASQVKIEQLYPPAVEMGMWNGKHYALPFWVGNETYLLWSADDFREVGLDPNVPPKTFAELDQFADKLTKRDASGKITRLGFAPNWSWTHSDGYAQFFAGKGSLFDAKSNQITCDNPEIVAAFDWEAGYFKRYGAEFIDALPSAWTPSMPFFAGVLSICLGGCWWSNLYRSGGFTGDWRVGPVPHTEKHPEFGKGARMGLAPWSIPTQAKHPDQAWQYMSWALWDPEVALWHTPSGQMSAYVPSWDDPKARMDVHYAAMMDYLKDAYVVWFPVDLPCCVEEYRNELVTMEDKILHLEISAAEGMKQLKDKMQPKIDAAAKK